MTEHFTPFPRTIPFNAERVQRALSSVRRELVYLTQETCPATVIDALELHFPGPERREWQERLAIGGTYINGEVTLTNMPLVAPCRIEHFEPRRVDRGSWDRALKSAARLVVYEDDELLVFFKPPGLASMPTREQVQHNLKALLLSYLGKEFPPSSLHMPSRLDTSVSGLVLASKHPAMHRPLQRMFEHRRLKKLYLLRTRPVPAWDSFDATGSIGRDPRHPVLRCVTDAAGKSAHTIFNKLLVRQSETYLSAQPVTGRTHQIRVHASSYGFPIDGDNFYAGAESPQLALMSAALRFIHPHSHRELLILAPAAALPEWIAPAWAEVEPPLRKLIEGNSQEGGG